MGGRRASHVCRTGLNAVLAVALAPRCAACARVLDAPLDGPVCPGCWSRVRPPSPPLCRSCGDALPSWRTVSLALEQCARCRRSRSLVRAVRAAGNYEEALRDILHAFKYDGRRTLALPLGTMMREAGAGLLGDADCVVPVPLHPWRRLRRGFNQANELAAHLGVPVAHLLWRTRPTVPQAGLAAAARRRNVRGAFRLSPLLTPSSRRRWLTGRVIVVVDDVRTTGATLDACAAVLLTAGAREVRALTMARARPPGSGTSP